MIELLVLLRYEWANSELDEKQVEYWDEQERERREEKEAVVKKERWLALETSVAVYTIFHPRIQMSQTGGVRSLSNSDGQSDGSQVIQQKMCIDWPRLTDFIGFKIWATHCTLQTDTSISTC